MIGNLQVVLKLSQHHYFAGVVARVEGLRGRNSAFEPREAERQVEELFESLLSESFGGGI